MSRYYFFLAFRGLRRTPWLALLMVLTLAVGLSACMVTNTLRHALAMDPIPGKSSRLLNLQDPTVPYGGGSRFSYVQARFLSRLGARYGDSVVSGLGLVTSISVAGQQVVLDGGLGMRYTTAGYFRMFDVPFKDGRIWTRQEEQSAAPVAVIGKEMADRLFPDTSPIGRQVVIGGTPYTVIGVLYPWNPQPHYVDLTFGAFGTGGAGLYVPVTAIQYAPSDMLVPQSCTKDHPSPASPSELLSSVCSWLSVWYLAHTRQDVAALTHAVKSQLAVIFQADRADRLQLLNVRQLLADIVPASAHLYAWLGAALLALCIVNASGMQLSRLMRGTSQIGIRRALGATRVDIVKQYLCDAMLVGSAGGVLGMTLTFAGLYGVRQLSFGSLPYANMAHMDGIMFTLMVLLVILCSALAGVAPAWLASRADPARVIKVAE